MENKEYCRHFTKLTKIITGYNLVCGSVVPVLFQLEILPLP